MTRDGKRRHLDVVHESLRNKWDPVARVAQHAEPMGCELAFQHTRRVRANVPAVRQVVIQPFRIYTQQQADAILKGRKVGSRKKKMTAGFRATANFKEKPIRIHEMFDNLAREDEIKLGVTKWERVMVQIAEARVDAGVPGGGNVLSVDINAGSIPASRPPEPSPFPV